MKYPCYNLGISYDVVGAYAHYIGEREPNDPATLYANAKRTPRRVARMIGRACKLRHEPGARVQANRMLMRAARQSESSIQTSEGRALRRLGMTARLLLSSTDNVHATRQGIHEETIAQITEVEKQLTRARTSGLGLPTNLVGEVGELICLGLVTRQAYPATLAVPALTHHDELTSTRDNHDILLVTGTLPNKKNQVTDEYEFDRIQVKTSCLGLCDNDPDKLTLNRTNYSSDVTFVSGHCDLGFPDGGLKRTSALLMREFTGSISPRHSDSLDSLSGNLILAMTMDDPRRLGTLMPAPHVSSAA